MLRVCPIAPEPTRTLIWPRIRTASTPRRCGGCKPNRRWLAAVWTAALLLRPAATLAAGPTAPQIRVQAQACPAVDASEVERLLAIELGALAPAGPIEVTLACDGARLRMTARDPVLDRQLVREVAVGPPDPGRDRTIALLVSQMFLTSWAEEFLEHPGPRAPAPAAAATQPAAGTSGSPASWELQVGGGARLRDWAAPALGEQISVRAGRQAGPVQLLAAVGFERGSADRAAGSAGWTIGELGAGMGWTSRRFGHLAFAVALLGSAAVGRVHGDPASAAYTGSAIRGVLGQAALAAGPRLEGDRWRAGLELELGATWPTATARVAGDRDVALGGPWAGGRLWIGWGRR